MTHRTPLLSLLLLALAIPAASAQNKPERSLTDVSGVWIMLVEGHQIGLELAQEGTAVKGVMLAMGRRQLLEGTYIDRELTLKGERPEDQGGTTHDLTAGPIIARMLDDGTLDGELSTNRGRRPWTGERLPKK